MGRHRRLCVVTLACVYCVHVLAALGGGSSSAAPGEAGTGSPERASPISLARFALERPKAAICFVKALCPPCEEMLTKVAQLARKYASDMDWVVVVEGDPKLLEPALSDIGAGVRRVDDGEGLLARDFDVKEFPSLFLLGQDEIVYSHMGYVPQYEPKLKQVLAAYSRDREIPKSLTQAQLTVGSKAPDIALPDASGKTWRSSNMGNMGGSQASRTLYILAISGCGPCHEAMRSVKANAHRMGDLEVVWVLMGAKKASLEDVKEIRPPGVVVFDANLDLFERYELYETPVFILVEGGTIAYVAHGWAPGKGDDVMQALFRAR